MDGSGARHSVYHRRGSMDYRGLVTLGACLAAGMVPLLPACKGPDPGAITFEERPSSSGETTTSGGGGSSSSSSGSTTTDGGGTGTVTDVFKAGEAFAYAAPDTTVNNTGHGAETAPMQGKACVKAGCHADLAGNKWAAGGSVYGDMAGAAFPADLKQKVQIRIVKADGTELGTFCPDDDGNFYLRAGDAFPPAGSRVGIRTDNGATKMMNAPIEGAAGANCNAAGCHDGARRIVAK